MINKTESEIQKEIIAFLKTQKCLIIRINGVSRGKIKGYWGYNGNEHLDKGIQDITVLKDGKFIAFEVKAAKGKQSEEQKVWEKWINDNGGEYYLVQSLQGVREIMKLM